MIIRNGQLADDFAKKAPVRLNLGCGRIIKPGFYGIDLVDLPHVDVIADLNNGMPAIPDDSVDEIVSSHALEHVQNFLIVMREIHRVLKRDGKAAITVPHFSNVFGFSDPTHVRFFGMHTMFYFCDPQDQPFRRKVPNFYSDTRFKVEKITIGFYKSSLLDNLIGMPLSCLVNSSLWFQRFYERRLAFVFHAREITFILTPVK